MMAMQLSEAADVLHAGLKGPDKRFSGISTDTRTLAVQNLFFALMGPTFDGHDYVQQAQVAGAAAAAVSRDVAIDLPLLQVGDTRAALGQLASHWRSRFSIPVIGVTGSNGKTTVKEMLAAILGCHGLILATKGNLNNDIGVPLTLAGLDQRHRAAVVEMGANHKGEIAYLTSLVQPTVGIVTNAGPAHLEGFGSIAGVAHAKGELFAGLGMDATAVINADDTYAGLWCEMAKGRRVIRFGLQASADVHGSYKSTAQGTELLLHSPQGAVTIQLPLLGRHNVVNALGAAAAALAAGVDLDTVRQGLENLRAVPGRMQRKTRRDGGLLIDDTYNANPASLNAAINVLHEQSDQSWLVLGDMAELGDDADKLHAEAGSYAHEAGIKRLYTVGELAAHAARAFGSGAEACADMEQLLAALTAELRPDTALLVKGSRRMGMERVVRALCDTAGTGVASC